ncbi:hypothetical protein [Ramlibacter tataouinensis]|uniref:Uncharacterized protein n=1 Tax=Ramlibacter tataouinensis (strain ATCC BAA-407 / DSM 14655 / LMG 21543 / TTB310) TaxID=365046 RepID=F5Y510_RAMTT|nr:hypothetical protein [Ramlibacter tataouinensis]AEG93850.1 Conserved hypothetical protein [Ramlibacter tataouinensis TTB310]
MANPPVADVSEGAPPRQLFTLYTVGGRIYCSNVDQKLVDLGALASREDGLCYVLDGNQLTGYGLPSQEAALREIAERIDFLWLDGQFTALADVRGQDGLNLERATRLDVALHVPQPGEPVHFTG